MQNQKIIYKKKKLTSYFNMAILIKILGIFFMVLPIFVLLQVFMFDYSDVEQKVIQKVRNYKNMLKNKIRTKWKI